MRFYKRWVTCTMRLKKGRYIFVLTLMIQLSTHTVPMSACESPTQHRTNQEVILERIEDKVDKILILMGVKDDE